MLAGQYDSVGADLCVCPSVWPMSLPLLLTKKEGRTHRFAPTFYSKTKNHDTLTLLNPSVQNSDELAYLSKTTLSMNDGSPNSSNSNRLKEVAQKQGVSADNIELGEKETVVFSLPKDLQEI